MKKDKTAIIRIDSYFVDCLIIGKVASAEQLKYRMIEVLEEAETRDFLSIFCARYNFEVLHDEGVRADYVIDLDTHLVYKPSY